MIDCAIVGDSIAIGVAPYLPECEVHAKIGVPSLTIVGYVRDAAVVVISAGSNDPTNPKLYMHLRAIRAKITGRVIWILPQHPRAASMVRQAARPGDGIVTFRPAGDRVHPRSNTALARSIKEEMKR